MESQSAISAHKFVPTISLSTKQKQQKNKQMTTLCHLTTLPHLDFNLVESLPIVHSNHGPNHLRQDDHVSQMGLHNLWLLHGGSVFLGLAQTLQEGLLLAAQATVQPPPLAGAVQLHQLLTAKKYTSMVETNYTHHQNRQHSML